MHYTEEDVAGLVVTLLDVGFYNIRKWCVAGLVALDDLTTFFVYDDYMVVFVEYLHGLHIHATVYLDDLS